MASFWNIRHVEEKFIEHLFFARYCVKHQKLYMETSYKRWGIYNNSINEARAFSFSVLSSTGLRSLQGAYDYFPSSSTLDIIMIIFIPKPSKFLECLHQQSSTMFIHAQLQYQILLFLPWNLPVRITLLWDFRPHLIASYKPLLHLFLN